MSLAAASPAAAQAAGRAFASYQRLLAEMQGEASAPLIKPVIANFHELAHYLSALRSADAAAAATTNAARASASRKLFAELQSRTETYESVTQARADLIHGDCKIDNLLFDPQQTNVVAVLDLDTTMVGQWWWDFGDLVRSVAQSASGEVDQVRFDAVAAGFFAVRSAATAPDEAELSLALLAPAFMTYMLCVRFLTDHLAGDEYFLVEKRGDNLERAQGQFRLLQNLEQPAVEAAMATSLGRLQGRLQGRL